jgi:hypothetical protein
MIILAYVFLGLTLVGSGISCAKDKAGWTEVVGTLLNLAMIIPLMGRVIGWW